MNMDAPPPEGIDRRTFIEATTISVLGAGLAGCTGPGNGEGTGTEENAVVDAIAETGYYSWFVEGGNGFRSTEPFDYEEGNARWVAEPTSDGAVRCRVKNVEKGTAGFELAVGTLGELDAVTIRSRSEADAKLFYALYLDKDDDGEFYKWKDEGTRMSFVDYGNDLEGVGSFPAGETFAIEDDTELSLPKNKSATLAELRNGNVAGIDGTTATALYVGILGDRNEELAAVVEAVNVQTTST